MPGRTGPGKPSESSGTPSAGSDNLTLLFDGIIGGGIMSKPALPCPSCGSPETREVTREELRARNDGKDPLVVVMPRVCSACGHEWEPPLSKSMCYLVASLAGIGLIAGVLIVAGVFWILIQSTLIP